MEPLEIERGLTNSVDVENAANNTAEIVAEIAAEVTAEENAAKNPEVTTNSPEAGGAIKPSTVIPFGLVKSSSNSG